MTSWTRMAESLTEALSLNGGDLRTLIYKAGDDKCHRCDHADSRQPDALCRELVDELYPAIKYKCGRKKEPSCDHCGHDDKRVTQCDTMGATCASKSESSCDSEWCKWIDGKCDKNPCCPCITSPNTKQDGKYVYKLSEGTVETDCNALCATDCGRQQFSIHKNTKSRTYTDSSTKPTDTCEPPDCHPISKRHVP